MSIDQIPEQESHSSFSAGGSKLGAPFLVVFVVLAALVVGEIYTVSQVGSVRNSMETQQVKMQRVFSDQLSDRFAALEHSNAQQLGALKGEVDSAAKRVGSTGKQLSKARKMVTELQQQQTQQAEALKQEISKKADQEQVLALTQDVSGTKTDLDSTRKNIDALSKEFGMTKTEFGTLIARNHDEIDQLRKLGERDYTEFTLVRNQPQRIGGFNATLKRINLKRHRFNLVLVADDMEIEKKDRTVNEPIFFYVAGSKKPYELVVNKVESSRIIGYLSTPKGAVEIASSAAGAAETH
jgi:hypothetical protein